MTHKVILPESLGTSKNLNGSKFEDLGDRNKVRVSC